MNHRDHVNLLLPANLPPGGVWADFGAGSGAFTLALRELVGSQAQIHAIDKDRGSLHELGIAYRGRFGEAATLDLIAADFSRRLELPPLDGALMANSLHYIKDGPAGRSPNDAGLHKAEDKLGLLHQLRDYLRPGGALLLVEYNVDSGNLWVPYPLSFQTWKALAPQAGFSEPRLLSTHPSHFLREFYSAVCYKAET